MVKEAGGALDNFAEAIRALVTDQRVRIFSFRQRGDTNLESAFEEGRKGATDGLLPRLVGIEAKNDRLDESAEETGLFRSEGRSLRSDHILHSGLKRANQVDLALANNGSVGFDERSLGFVESVEHAALGKQGVSGELTYFAVLASGSRRRPLKAITSP